MQRLLVVPARPIANKEIKGSSTDQSFRLEGEFGCEMQMQMLGTMH